MRPSLSLRLFVAVVLLSFVSYAGRGAYKRGLALSKNGSHGQAVAAYEEALREDPKDTRYQQALEQAKDTAHAQLLEWAQHSLTNGELNAAQTYTDSARKYRQTAELDTLEGQIKTEREFATSELALAKEDAAAGRVEDALKRIRGVRRYARTFAEIAQVEESLSNTLLNSGLAQSNDLLAKGELQQALDVLERALTWLPQRNELLTLRERVSNKLKSREALQRGQAALKANRLRDAVTELSAAVMLDAENNTAVSDLLIAQGKLAEQLSSTARTSWKQGQRGTALAQLKEASSLAAGIPALKSNVDALAQEYGETLARTLDSNAQTATRNGHLGATYLYLRAAALLRGRGSSEPLPDLNPLLQYRVSIQPLQNRTS